MHQVALHWTRSRKWWTLVRYTDSLTQFVYERGNSLLEIGVSFNLKLILVQNLAEIIGNMLEM